MEQRTIAEVAKSAQVFSTAETARAQRRERLERLARLLEEHDGPVQMLTQIEYLRRSERLLLRRDGSPLTIAYKDPVFRAQGLAGDRLGDAMTFWARDPNVFYQVNVDGTRNVIKAAEGAGCERLVFTSTVGVLSQRGPGPADETSVARPGDLHGHYKRSKYAAEHEILRAGAEGLDVTLVLPTFPLGPGDLAPTPTGKVIVDYLNGRLPGYADTSLNVVHVDDLAQGHVAALERGRSGRSYIIGGENMPMRAILEVLAGFAGRPAPSLRVPAGLAALTGAASTLIEGRVLRREPRVPFEAARMAADTMTFNDARARSELGYQSRPAREAILDSARWFKAHGYANRRA